MGLIPEKEKERVLALGYEGLMREIAEGKHCQPTSPYRDEVDDLLRAMRASEDAAAAVRAERREEDSISIARRAFHMAIWANAIAIVAIIIAMKGHILAFFFGVPP